MSVTVSAVSVRVPAKINIRLAVGALRPDGYHRLHTVFHAVDLCDTVTAAPATDLQLELTGPESAGLPTGSTNLAWRAAELLAGRAGIAAQARLQVDKAIPVAAGLAGGSADAAATLLACRRLWPAAAGLDLDELAARLGSDVNFALHGGSAHGTGRGEQLTGIDRAARFHWVLAYAEGQLSTPAVYAELDRQRAAAGQVEPTGDLLDPAEATCIEAALRSGDPARLAPLLGNDLQPAALALAPYLAATLAAGIGAGALAGLVCGSGPTCAFLVRDQADALRLAGDPALRGACRATQAVVGGVPGAELLTGAVTG